MLVTAKGHHGGNPALYCGSLTLEPDGADAAREDWEEARDLALLFRVLASPQTRSRLLELAERVEAEEEALSDALTG